MFRRLSKTPRTSPKTTTTIKNETPKIDIELEISSAIENHKIIEVIKGLLAHASKGNYEQYFFKAIQFDYLDLVKWFVDEEILDINTDNINNYVFEAARHGHLALVKYFIEEKKFDINTASYTGDTILDKAIIAGQNHIIDYFLEKGSNVGHHTIESAVLACNIELLKKLFDHKAKIKNEEPYAEDQLVALVLKEIIDTENYYSETQTIPLEKQLKYVPILKILLENGATPNCIVAERGQAIQLALDAYKKEPKNPVYKDVSKLLLQYGANTLRLKKSEEYKDLIQVLTDEIIQEPVKIQEDKPHNNSNEEESALIGDIFPINEE